MQRSATGRRSVGRRTALLGWLLAAGLAALTAPGCDAPGSDDPCWLPTPETADDVREAAIRELLTWEELDAAQGLLLGISHGEGEYLGSGAASPQPDFMERFEDLAVPVEVAALARYDESTGAAMLSDGTRPAAAVSAGPVTWLGRNKASVQVCFAYAGNVGSGFHMELERKGQDGWVVVDSYRIWTA